MYSWMLRRTWKRYVVDMSWRKFFRITVLRKIKFGKWPTAVYWSSHESERAPNELFTSREKPKVFTLRYLLLQSYVHFWDTQCSYFMFDHFSFRVFKRKLEQEPLCLKLLIFKKKISDDMVICFIRCDQLYISSDYTVNFPLVYFSCFWNYPKRSYLFDDNPVDDNAASHLPVYSMFNRVWCTCITVGVLW